MADFPYGTPNVFGNVNPKPGAVTRNIPTMGSSFASAQQTGGLMRNTPSMATSSTPYGNQNVQTQTPFSGFGMNTNSQLPNTNVQTQTPNPMGFTGQYPQAQPTPYQDMGQSGGGQQNGFQSGGFETQYATPENLQPYMNPYLDQIIGRGNQAIQGSAAAKGLLGSSATLNNIGEWTAQATSNEYGNALNRFGADRDYVTNAYRDNRNFDYGNYRDTNAWDYGMFTDERTDYNSRMNDWYLQMLGISNTGNNAANNAGNIQTNLGYNLAQLFGNRGDVGAAQAMGQGANNSGLLGGIISLLGGLL